MSDDTTPAFTRCDSYPLDAAHQLDALREQNERLSRLVDACERRINELSARVLMLLSAADRIAALQQQAEELHAINRRLRDTLDAVRPVLRMVGPAAEGLVARINDVIGPDVLDRLWIEQTNSGHAAPVQGDE